jgi:predicted molibdopterin-dependent oxidoreductase YjgC
VREALGKPALRVHQDIYVTTQMLVDPAETVVLLPAQTRYEQRGGGTETSTERRIIFSPQIPGPHIGEARCEWEIFTDLAGRVHPEQRERITFKNAQEIRDEIARVMPNYAGIERLRKKGDQVQYGGRYLYANGEFQTPDKKGHFSALTPPELDLPEGKFVLSTRRGKQFNSLIHAKKDVITGASRDALLISAEDAAALGVATGDRVLAKSDNGASMEFRVRVDRIQPRSVQAFWPECNALIRRRVCDVAAGVPDYNAIIELTPVRAVERVAVGVGS